MSADTEVGAAQEHIFKEDHLAHPHRVLAIGTAVSLLQAVTQVQEMTLTFVPKVSAIAIVLMLSGGWMLNELADFTRGLYQMAPTLLN